MTEPYGTIADNTYSPHKLEPSAIPYSIDQSTDLQLQDSSFCVISIFRINEYLEDDAKNITFLLYKIATFIRQKKLENKTTKDISQTEKFGFIIWDFILSIYKSNQNRLIACKNNSSFRQCMSSQFKTKASSVKSNKKNNLINSGKQANISRVSSPICYDICKD